MYAYPYMMIYLLGTLPSMIAVGMNPFINAQGYSVVGMLSVAIGAVANLILDPLFIFVLGFGVRGAAIATILSQTLSAAFVLFFLTGKAELKVRFLRKNEISECTGYAKNIVSLGMAGFIMQLTNSLVTICCNNVLSVTGGLRGSSSYACAKINCSSGSYDPYIYRSDVGKYYHDSGSPDPNIQFR